MIRFLLERGLESLKVETDNLEMADALAQPREPHKGGR
jgi:hypothetical protein